MEGLYNGLHRKGQVIESATSLRLPKRPQSDSNPNPKAFEDFGISLAPKSSQMPPRSKLRSASIVSQKPTRPISIKKPLSEFFSESEDEIDFLSSSQAEPDDFEPSNKTSISKVGKDMNEKGNDHNYDVKFLPSKSGVLGKLKFTKINKLGGENNSSTPSSSYSALKNPPDSKENGQDFGSWVNSLKNKAAENQITVDTPTGSTNTHRRSLDDDVLDISSPLRVKSSNRRLIPSRPPPKQPIHRERSTISIPPRPRPLPRRANADASGSKPSANGGSGLSAWSTSQFKSSAIMADGLELIPLGRTKTTTSTSKKKIPSRSPSPEISISTPTKNDRMDSQPRSSPQNFPMDMISPLGGKAQQKPLPKLGSKTRVNAANPSSFEASPKLDAFPMPSPQSSDRGGIRVTSQSKGKNKVQPFPLDDDENEGDEESGYDPDVDRRRVKAKGRQKSRAGLQAFPMPSQMLDSIGPPSLPKARLLKHRKRASESRTDDEQQAKKKRRSSVSPSQCIFEDEGDSITISPDTDPRTLCPYCDTPLPSSPSPFLVNILAATRKKATRDPRPSNPLGLKAPLATFIVACQRHKFESQILPEAERKGWPKMILWEELGARVERMKDELQTLIEDPGGEREVDDVNEDIDEVDGLSGRKDPKTKSIFWTEVMDEVKKKGSRAVVGVRGQFANFEKTQPGYYGEQGSVIIHQTLFDMFPPTSFDPAWISPLTSNEFILRILVPEVALRLIMEDRDLGGNDGMRQALIVLRESSAYGVAMFPEDGGEWGAGKKRGGDAVGVGDKIVMERARKRRKELEEEEEREEREVRSMAEMEAEVVTREAKKAKAGGKRKGKQGEEQQGEQQAPVERPRPRPRPVVRSSSSMSILPPSDHEETLQPPQPSARHKFPRHKDRTRARSMYSSPGRSGDFSSRPVTDLSASESDECHRPTSKERRRSPSASESGAERRKDKARKLSSTGAPSRGLAMLNVSSESDVTVGGRTSTEPAMRRSLRKNPNALRRSDSTKNVDLDEEDMDDVNLEIEDVLDVKTPVRKHSHSFNHQSVTGTSNDEQTPKPVILRETGGSNDIKPLMVARKRQSQRNNSESNFGEAGMPHRAYIHVEDAIDEEVEALSPNRYRWLLSDTSQSSMGGNSTLRRS